MFANITSKNSRRKEKYKIKKCLNCLGAQNEQLGFDLVNGKPLFNLSLQFTVDSKKPKEDIPPRRSLKNLLEKNFLLPILV